MPKGFIRGHGVEKSPECTQTADFLKEKDLQSVVDITNNYMYIEEDILGRIRNVFLKKGDKLLAQNL